MFGGINQTVAFVVGWEGQLIILCPFLHSFHCDSDGKAKRERGVAFSVLLDNKLAIAKRRPLNHTPSSESSSSSSSSSYIFHFLFREKNAKKEEACLSRCVQRDGYQREVWLSACSFGTRIRQKLIKKKTPPFFVPRSWLWALTAMCSASSPSGWLSLALALPKFHVQHYWERHCKHKLSAPKMSGMN